MVGMQDWRKYCRTATTGCSMYAFTDPLVTSIATYFGVLHPFVTMPVLLKLCRPLEPKTCTASEQAVQ